MRITLPLFGEIDLAKLPLNSGDALEAEHSWQGHLVQVRLWFSRWISGQLTVDPTWPEADAKRMVVLLQQADQLLQRSMDAFVHTASDPGSATADYLEFHREELPAFAALSDAEFLQAMRPQYLSFQAHPDDGSSVVAVVDFSIDPEQTQYVLCAAFDADAHLLEVAMES